MFKLRETLDNRARAHQLPPGYDVSMGIVALCGRRPVSITHLRNSPCPESVFIHFKSLLPINDPPTPPVPNAVPRQFFDDQFTAMQRLFAEGDVAVLRGTTEDLSGNAALAGLIALEVGSCPISGTLTAEQRDLYANRNNVGENEVVVYVVQSMLNSGAATSLLGCATQQAGRGPGVAVVQGGARWLAAHEVGHALGLTHVCEVATPGSPPPAVPCAAGHSDSLMFPNVGWTNTPPDLTATEYTTMRNSGLTRPCA